MTALDGWFNNAKKAMTALDGCFSTSGPGAEWYKKTNMGDEEHEEDPQNGGKLDIRWTGPYEGREDGILHRMWGMVPRRMPAHTKTSLAQSVSGTATTVEYNRVYIIVYIFLIHICVHRDMLNINEIIVHPQ